MLGTPVLTRVSKTERAPLVPEMPSGASMRWRHE
jgi:hypothetical protein